MAGNEHQPQQIVANVFINRAVIIRRGQFPGLELASKLFMLTLEQSSTAQVINRTMLCSRHEPRARIIWDARLRPLFERSNESVLREFFRASDIADDPRETSD